jgi:hypothetical protein
MHVVELKAAAKMFAKHLKLHNFTCSSGWMWRFKQRHNISNRNIFGDALVMLKALRNLEKIR